MHLLAAAPGTIADGSEAVELGQTPGEIVVLSAADSELACLARALPRVSGVTLRLANLMRLAHPLSVDLYVEQVIAQARLVVVRLLGGRGYWSYGVEQVEAACRERNIPVAFLPGDDQPDADLATRSTVAADPPTGCGSSWSMAAWPMPNSSCACAGSLIGRDFDLARAGTAAAGRTLSATDINFDALRARRAAGRPLAALTVYRALVQAGDAEAIDALIAALPLARPRCAADVCRQPQGSAGRRHRVRAAGRHPPDVILTTTAFAVAVPGGSASDSPFAASDCPVLQVIFAGIAEQAWRDSAAGLGPRDIAMNMALPEVDGRIITRAVAFKASARRDEATQCDIVTQRPVPDRIDFVADLAAGWARLRRKPAAERRVALILANYPNRDGRIGNGVGLDTPASTVDALRAIAAAGYRVDGIPADGAALMAALLAGPTNALPAARRAWCANPSC